MMKNRMASLSIRNPAVTASALDNGREEQRFQIGGIQRKAVSVNERAAFARSRAC
jgi:hypothetical protein